MSFLIFWDTFQTEVLHYASASILHASHRVELLMVEKMLATALSHSLSVIVIDL